MGNFNFGYKPNSPCVRECKDRCATCHSTCQKYLEWTKKWQKEKAVIRAKMKEETAYNDYEFRELSYRSKKSSTYRTASKIAYSGNNGSIK